MSEVSSRSVPAFSFDLSSLLRRSVASFGSHLVTRPTGRALRLGIENHLRETGAACLSVLDFTHVVVLDYSCADEVVAKLILQFLAPDPPIEAYFVAKGLGEHHRDPLEVVLARHGLALVAEVEPAAFALLGAAAAFERDAWTVVQEVQRAEAAEVARRLSAEESAVRSALDALAHRRLLLRQPSEGGYCALSGLLSVV